MHFVPQTRDFPENAKIQYAEDFIWSGAHIQWFKKRLLREHPASKF